MKASKRKKLAEAWLRRLAEETQAHPHRDTLTGVQRQGTRWTVFSRERGCEREHRSFSTAAEAVAHLAGLVTPPDGL